MNISDSNLSQFIDKILAISQPQIINIDDRDYTTKVIAPMLDHAPKKPLVFKSLKGLVDYINFNVDGLDPHKIMIHVESPYVVSVNSMLTPKFLQRFEYAKSHYDQPEFAFDVFQQIDRAIISLQSHFVMTEELQILIQIIGNITDSDIREVSDDTVTQSVVVRSAVSLKDRIKIPNPITLRPYRTFSEIEQPAGQYIVRVRSENEKALPTVALFNSGGMQWQLAAMDAINKFLFFSINDKNIPILA
jgi:hypothetical protein